MCNDSLFIPESVKSRNSFQFYFKITKGLSEFRNYLCRQIQWNKKEMREGISISHTNTHPYVGIIQIRLWVEAYNFLSACGPSSPCYQSYVIWPDFILNISRKNVKSGNRTRKVIISLRRRRNSLNSTAEIAISLLFAVEWSWVVW